MSKESLVGAGKKVRISYTVRVNNQVIETTEGKPHLYYEHGKKQLLPALQKKLEGSAAGDELNFELTPEQAYGQRDREKIQKVALSEVPPKEKLKEGMVLQEKLADGSLKVGRILEIHDDGVVLDLNHPMAGKTLSYHVKIINVMSGPENPNQFPKMDFS